MVFKAYQLYSTDKTDKIGKKDTHSKNDYPTKQASKAKAAIDVLFENSELDADEDEAALYAAGASEEFGSVFEEKTSGSQVPGRKIR